jgi:hypothetical protein
MGTVAKYAHFYEIPEIIFIYKKPRSRAVNWFCMPIVLLLKELVTLPVTFSGKLFVLLFRAKYNLQQGIFLRLLVLIFSKIPF